MTQLCCFQSCDQFQSICRLVCSIAILAQTTCCLHPITLNSLSNIMPVSHAERRARKRNRQAAASSSETLDPPANTAQEPAESFGTTRMITMLGTPYIKELNETGMLYWVKNCLHAWKWVLRLMKDIREYEAECDEAGISRATKSHVRRMKFDEDYDGPKMSVISVHPLLAAGMDPAKWDVILC